MYFINPSRRLHGEIHAAKFNYDIKKIVEHYKIRQNKTDRKIVNFIKKSDEIHTETY